MLPLSAIISLLQQLNSDFLVWRQPDTICKQAGVAVCQQNNFYRNRKPVDLAQRLEHQNKWGSFHLESLQMRKKVDINLTPKTDQRDSHLNKWGHSVTFLSALICSPPLIFHFAFLWHNVSHQPPRDAWNNFCFSLLKVLWVTDFQFIS